MIQIRCSKCGRFSAQGTQITSLALASMLILACAAPPVSAQSVEGGKFGRALKVVDGSYAAVGYNQIYFVIPLTVECWVKLPPKPATDATIISCQPRHSNEHWEIYASAGDGLFCGSLGGYAPRPIKSTAAIADDQWHFLALTFDGKTVQLFGLTPNKSPSRP